MYNTNKNGYFLINFSNLFTDNLNRLRKCCTTCCLCIYFSILVFLFRWELLISNQTSPKQFTAQMCLSLPFARSMLRFSLHNSSSARRRIAHLICRCIRKPEHLVKWCEIVELFTPQVNTGVELHHLWKQRHVLFQTFCAF